MVRRQTTVAWYNERGWSALLATGALLLAYAIGAHALDTGSWQQYFLTAFLVVLAINRVWHALRMPHPVGGK